MILSSTLYALEKVINHGLSMDPTTVEQLQKLKGKIVKLEIQKVNLNLFIIPDQQGIRLEHRTTLEPDTIIAGTPDNLLRLACAKGDTHAVFQHQLSISGDLELAQSLRDILKNLDIDWERQISRVVGDTAAYQLMRFGKRFKQECQTLKDKLRSESKTFLEMESELLPCREEFEKFSDQVSELRNTTDRIEARIKHFKNRQEKSQ